MKGCTLTNDWAARQALVWLQIFTAALSLIGAFAPHRWISGPCAEINKRADGFGICDCEDAIDSGACYSNQLVFRIQGSATVVFALLTLLSLSGCVSCAARHVTVAKFISVILLAFVLCFLPNDFLTAFGSFSSCASALFLIVQAVLVIDFGYNWNETWFTKALAARRGPGGFKAFRRWQIYILSSAAAFLIAAVVAACLILRDFPKPQNWALVAPVGVLSIVLLVVSITDWCEHGSLLTSSVFLAYSMWLCYEALSLVPRPGVSGPSAAGRWAELSACAVTLAAIARYTGMGFGGQHPASPARLEGGEAGDAENPEEEGSRTEPKVYAVQCFAHAAAAVYVCAALAPSVAWVPFSMRTVATAGAVLLYGWSLVAPKVLTGRNFG